MPKVVLAGLAAAALGLLSDAEGAEAPAPEPQNWSFSGIFGTFDGAARQRGFQVFKEVCAGCHGIERLYYRNLSALGFSAAEVDAIAAQYEVTDGPNEEGEMFQRPAKPSDRFVPPFANEQAARAANNGIYPPDLSLITKARPRGADYLYALITGFADPPEGVEVLEGAYYNPYFPGGQIGMPPPLFPDAVTFADGTPATVPRMASDVTTFLAWVAEPEMEERKRLGVKVLLFVLVLTGLFYALKRKVWSEVH